TPSELLSTCLEIEKENQRIRNNMKGPRTLDIDIIFYGNEIIRTPGLTIPHASFSVRRFVLVPLAEIVPEFIDPLSRMTIAKLLESCSDHAEVRFFGRPTVNP